MLLHKKVKCYILGFWKPFFLNMWNLWTQRADEVSSSCAVTDHEKTDSGRKDNLFSLLLKDDSSAFSILKGFISIIHDFFCMEYMYLEKNIWTVPFPQHRCLSFPVTGWCSPTIYSEGSCVSKTLISLKLQQYWKQASNLGGTCFICAFFSTG